MDKQFCKSFLKKSTSWASQPLQEIHVDICGLIKPCSFGKNIYFLLFIDDYSRKTWIYFLKKSLICLVVLISLRHLLKKKFIL
jgi:hypothetical protein